MRVFVLISETGCCDDGYDIEGVYTSMDTIREHIKKHYKGYVANGSHSFVKSGYEWELKVNEMELE